ncbi:MAG: Chemotaxis protein methyltransferase [Pseudomonas citronellolis]|nr:MAG: Chemotaxis protein methyltransferase [Pseudomonas citronellolis]
MPTRHLPRLADADFRRLQQMMLQASGIRMAEQKRTLMAGRLMCRLRARNLGDYAAYLRLLEAPEENAERRLVVDLLTTNETYFFREPQHFDVLGQWAAGQRKPLRLWSAAASSGQEAFSMAMTLAEHGPADWSILASDLSQRVLEKGRRGIYPMEQAAHLPAGWLERHCLRGIGDSSGTFRIGNPLRQRVSFAEVNLARTLPAEIGEFEAIFLRNVLIYFSSAEKRAIVARLIERLAPGGRLFIGHAESLHGLDLPLRSVRPSVFERTDAKAHG